MMHVFMRQVFLLLYIITICVAVQYKCDNRYKCGCGYSDVETNSSCITTGEDVVEASWTMFVSVRSLNSTQHICGGTLLSNLYVLTAAHCVKSFSSSIDLSNLTIVAGITDPLDSARYIRNIRQIHIHPNFTDQTNGFVNDLAILELDYRLLVDSNPLLSRTCIAQINSSILTNDSQLINIGWEIIEHEQSVELGILQQTQVFTIENTHQNCSNLIKDIQQQFCVEIYQDRKGDSGEAIFQWTEKYWEQIGIVSNVDDFGVSTSSKIYTRLSFYVDWINKIINDTSQPVQISTASRPFQTITTQELDQTSATLKPNCALKHQTNIIESKIFIFISLTSLIKHCVYI